MSSAYDPKMFNRDDMSTWPTDEQLKKAVAQNDAIAQVLLDMKRQSKSNPSSKPISNLNPNGADFAENLRSLQIKIGNTTLIADPNDPADLKAAREMASNLVLARKPGASSLDMSTTLSTPRSIPEPTASSICLRMSLKSWTTRT